MMHETSGCDSSFKSGWDDGKGNLRCREVKAKTDEVDVTDVAPRALIALRRRVRNTISIRMNDLVAPRDKVSPSGVGREWWPIGRKLRRRSEAAVGGGDGLVGAATCRTDEWWARLFLSLPFRRAAVEWHLPRLPSKPTWFYRQTGWCQWTHCSPPPPCIWLANGFPWQLILN